MTQCEFLTPAQTAQRPGSANNMHLYSVCINAVLERGGRLPPGDVETKVVFGRKNLFSFKTGRPSDST